MRKTLKQIITLFETFADDHLVINSFECNPINFNFADNITYPLMFVEIGDFIPTPGNVDINITVYFLDLLKRDKSNYVQVLSDTMKMCLDFYSIYNNNEADYGILFKDDARAVPWLFQSEDNAAGYKMSLTVQCIFDVNEDAVPI